MRRILFVDDEPRVLQGIQRMMYPQRQAWEMSFATSGPEALTIVAAKLPDVIVTDMRMPGMDGAALLTRVRDAHPNIVRIVLSGYPELAATMRAVPVAHQFLVKPCPADKLYETVERACNLRALLGSAALRQAVGNIASLPAAPRLYARLTQVLASPDSSIAQISQVIAADVAMSAKILQLVNSAFVGLSRRITNVATAVAHLGAATVKNLALSAEVFKSFEAASLVEGFSADALQTHATLTANIARGMLADPLEIEDAFMAGMLHDIGQLVAAAKLPQQFACCLSEAAAKQQPLHVVERALVGISHAELGAYLLGLWGIPNPVVEAVAFHHMPAQVRPQRFGPLAAVHVANCLAHEAMAKEHPGSGSGNTTHLDSDYLRLLNVMDRLPAWREIAARHVARLAAES